MNLNPYSVFFDKFIGLKLNVSIILNKSLPTDFYAMFLIFTRIHNDYCFIDIMGLNFFNDKFFYKINIFKSNAVLHLSKQIHLS